MIVSRRLDTTARSMSPSGRNTTATVARSRSGTSSSTEAGAAGNDDDDDDEDDPDDVTEAARFAGKPEEAGARAVELIDDY